MNKIQVFIPVDEDWYGNYKIADDQRHTDTKLIGVAFFKLMTANDMWRVCAWGNDDYGLEYDTPNKDEAEAMFIAVVTTFRPTQAWFKRNGFVLA